MERTCLLRFSLLLVLFLLLHSRTTLGSGRFWSGSKLEFFLIDGDNDQVIMTGKNMEYLLPLDLDCSDPQECTQLNVNLTNEQFGRCQSYYDLDGSDCHNFHEILDFPKGDGNVPTTDVPLRDTFLTCVTNGFSPECHYKKRKDLTEVATFGSEHGIFAPFVSYSHARSVVLEDGRLVTGTMMDSSGNSFGVIVSNSTYHGSYAVKTLLKDLQWFYDGKLDPEFVDLYEVDEFIYIFFREEAYENKGVIYSRVARVCKNDPGLTVKNQDGNDQSMFSSFMKTRIACTAGTGVEMYSYSELQDTFLLRTGSYDGEGDEVHLYGVFSSNRNGPQGSAVCVFDFDSDGARLDLKRVFTTGNYLVLENNAFKSEKTKAFTCAENRTSEKAKTELLMESATQQQNGEFPLVAMLGYTFHRIVVDQVQALDGNIYEVMFIAADHGGGLVLVKLNRNHVCSVTPLTNTLHDTTVTKMELHGSGSDATVYIGTVDGLYMEPVVDCRERYGSNCAACVGARDPYCAFDFDEGRCSAVPADDGLADIDASRWEQNVLNASVSEACRTYSGNTVSPTTTTNSQQTTDDEHAETPEPSATPSPPIAITDGVKSSDGSDINVTWITVAGVVSFVLGAFFSTIVILVIVFRRKFLIYDYFSPSHQEGVLEQEKGDGGVEGKRYRPRGASNLYSKGDEFERNNSDTKIQQLSNSPGNANRLAVKQQQFSGPGSASNLRDPSRVSPAPLFSSSYPSPYSPALGSSPSRGSGATGAGASLGASVTMTTADVNIKSNIVKEERILNRDRQQFGPNIHGQVNTLERPAKTGVVRKQNGFHPVPPVTYQAQRDTVAISDSTLSSSVC